MLKVLNVSLKNEILRSLNTKGMGEADKCADVIIVGAGISGLVAAECLKSRDPNLNVLVLEAASQIGGRTSGAEVKIANDPCQEIDVGGEWILGSQVNLLQLVDRLGLQTYAPVSEEGVSLKVVKLEKLIF